MVVQACGLLESNDGRGREVQDAVRQTTELRLLLEMKDRYPIRGRTFEALRLSRQQVNHLRSEKFAAKHQTPKSRRQSILMAVSQPCLQFDRHPCQIQRCEMFI